MERIVELTGAERKAALAEYRRNESRHVHMLLLLDAGRRYREITDWLFCSNDFIAGVVKQFRAGGLKGVLHPSDSEEEKKVPGWLVQVAIWTEFHTPRDFGYFRTRWSCETLAEVLAWETSIRVSRETIRRGLQRIGYRWRRPRPIVGPVDLEYDEKLRKIQDLLLGLPDDETAVFQDEVDVNLNPKIGCAWMRRGRQAEVRTPGNNVKRHFAGSLHWRTGRLIVSEPSPKRNAALFVAHLQHLVRVLRHYEKIHVICDNARFHDCKAVQAYLKTEERIVLHFLPKYAPETNPIERSWWHLHETLTRNHHCQTIDELLGDVKAWLRNRHLTIESHLYRKQAA